MLLLGILPYCQSGPASILPHAIKIILLLNFCLKKQKFAFFYASAHKNYTSFRRPHFFLLQDFHPGSRTYIYSTCNRPLEFLIMTVCFKREMTEYSLILLFIDHISCNMIFFWVKTFVNCFYLSNFRNIYVFL